MDPKANQANQEYQGYQAHLVFVVTWEILVLEVKTGPLLLDPQVPLGHVEWMVRKECQENLHLLSQEPLEIGVFRECQG